MKRPAIPDDIESAHTMDGLFYHYTDAAGLLGIVGTANKPPTIWMTQIDFMNDSAEASHAHTLRHVAMQQLKGYEDPALAPVIKQLYENYGWYHRPGVFEPPRLYGGRRFVFALSPQDDLLSQWRGYAHGGGYSLGFDRRDLEPFAAAQGLTLRPCVYDDKLKEDEIRAEVQRLYAQFKAGAIHPNIQSEPQVHAEDKVWASLRYELTQVFPRFSAYFKHSSFLEEQEVRMFGYASIDDPRSRWRVRGNLPLPYIELDVSGKGSYPALPVRRIVIGPQVDSLRARAAIDYVVWERNPKVQVDVSTCTLS